MSSKPKTPDDILKNLAEVLSDEVMAQSDDEVLSQAKADHSDVDAHVESLKASVAERVAAKRKERLIRARGALNDVNATAHHFRLNRSLSELKETARALFEQRQDLPERLTVAFRSGESMSDDDWASLIDDLVELGFLSNE